MPTALESTEHESFLVLDQCRVQDSRGAAVTCHSGGAAAVVGSYISGSGGEGVLVRGGGRAVMRDSYVFWNEGPGVRVEADGIMTLEYNDCSHNGGGPLVCAGVIAVRY